MQKIYSPSEILEMQNAQAKQFTARYPKSDRAPKTDDYFKIWQSWGMTKEEYEARPKLTSKKNV